MSTIYRYDDSRSAVSRSRRDGGVTKVTRYIVKDDDSRSVDRHSFVPERPGERVETTRILRREREVGEPVREVVRHEEPRHSSEQIVIHRDTRDDDRRSYYETLPPRREDRVDDRDEIVIRRTKEVTDPRLERDDLTVARLDDRRDTHVIHRDYRDDYDIVSAPRGFDDRDLARYTRQTDYYAPAPQPPPQTIIIRQDPIIIRERVRDDDYVSVRKSDADEERSVVRRPRSPDPPPRPAEEEYFYEKKVKERIDEPREDEWRERKSMRRELSPDDSVSQAGRRSRRNSYSSDDSIVYVKRTKEEYDSDDDRSRHRKNLAAGAIAGVGAAEILRSHSKKRGKDTAHGVGRLGRDVGAGALGAVAAEGISRVHRSLSRHRARSESEERDSHRHRHRSRARSRARSDTSSPRRRYSRSRSSSRSKLKTWGAVGLGAAALAAAAAIAQRKMGDKNERSPPRGRSQSRRRPASVHELANDPDAPADDARNPNHRNLRMAEAGAAGAAVTALIEHARSKSRGGRSRSRSRIRQAVPIVAAGLGTAAIAGLYEKKKAHREAESIAHEQRRAARRASRSRSRARSEYSDYPRDHNAGQPMIEYGDGAMYGNNYGREYYPGSDQYGRPPPQEPYYASQTAVVPATHAARETRDLSPERRSRSRSSSPDGHRHRHRRSRSRSGGREAAAAVAGAEREQYADPYDDTYNPAYATAPQQTAPTEGYQPQQQPYYPQPNQFPQTSQFPPPPGPNPPQQPQNQQPQPSPSPAPGYPPYAAGANPYAPPRRGGDENVSVLPNPTFPTTNSAPPPAGVSAPRDFTPSPDAAEYGHPPPIVSPQPPTLDGSPVRTYIPPTERDPSPPVRQPSPVTRQLSPARQSPPVRQPSPPASQLSPPPLPRAVSQPPPSSSRKSVQFAERPDIKSVELCEPVSPEPPRSHRQRERGYEAGDDTDSPVEDRDRRSRDRGSHSRRSLDADSDSSGDDDRRRRRHRHHHSRRSSEPPNARSVTNGDRHRAASPDDSDSTVDLPPRFDSKGNKRIDSEDPLVDRIEEILQGKGTAGKVLGSFVDGIFGPDGRKKSHH
ncbi:hypothetical protein DV738_g3344, partial [Chaetothyriales sp. CBS 135597]